MAPRLWLVSLGKFTFDGSFGIHTNTLIDYYMLHGDGQYVKQMAFSPNGKLLAWVSGNFTVRLLSVEECKIMDIPGQVAFITFLRDSTLVICENYTSSVRLLNTGTGEVENEMQFPEYSELECSSDGSSVAVPLANDSIELWDTEKGEIKHVFPRTWKATPDSIKLSSNGELLAVTHSAGCTILSNTGKEAQERMFPGIPWNHSRVFFSPKNQVMALVNWQGIYFGDETWFGDKHGQPSNRISGVSFTPDSRIIFSLDGKLAAFVMPDSEIRLCGTGQGEKMRVLKGHSGYVTSVAFSPISPLLASASRDHTVILWDTEKGEKLCTLIAHSDRVTKVAFSPNGELVATASLDGRVGLWNVSQWMTKENRRNSQTVPT